MKLLLRKALKIRAFFMFKKEKIKFSKKVKKVVDKLLLVWYIN